MQVKKQQLKPDIEQRTGSKSGKEYVKAVYRPPYLFNLYAEYIMWDAGLDEAQAGIKIARRNINKDKGDQSWVFTGRTEAETPVLWLPDTESWLIWKDRNGGKD